VAVALMQAMQLQAGRSAAEQAEVFARQLHGNWGVGRAGCDDGVLLLLSVQDRQVRRVVPSPQHQFCLVFSASSSVSFPQHKFRSHLFKRRCCHWRDDPFRELPSTTRTFNRLRCSHNPNTCIGVCTWIDAKLRVSVLLSQPAQCHALLSTWLVLDGIGLQDVRRCVAWQ